jgi:hypothetical protein
MQFDQSLIDTKYEALPQELKNLIDSPEVGIKLLEIGAENNLHFDKLGLLSDEVIAVVLNLKKKDDFVGNIESLLSIDRKTAESITSDINEKILKPVQHLLFGEHTNYDDIKKDDLLAEIENPTPHQTNKIETGSVTAAKPEEIQLKQVETKEAPKEIPQKVLDPVQSIIEKKLSETVSSPSEHKVIEDKKIPKIDPYREPIA